MVITLDKRKQPLGFCSERRARILLEKRRACVFKHYPFTIIIKDIDVRTLPEEAQVKDYRIKIDPGSKYTGLSIIREGDNAVVYFLQIEHRADKIVKDLKARHDARRNRRQRETWYRKCKFINHYLKKGSKYKAETPRPEGWLPPSMQSIGDNIINWVYRLCELININACSFEAVRFDTQLLDNPDIDGIEYQQGELFGYELKEYLLDKYGHICQYCGGKSGDTVLEWEHIQPRSKGGSNSVKNATLACKCCNQAKSNLSLQDWLAKEKNISEDHNASKKRSELAKARVSGIESVMENKPTKVSSRYCAWANTLRAYIEKQLFEMFGTVECASGGRTKYNRTRLGLPKDHHYDALCVGDVPKDGYKDLTNGCCLYIKAIGRGTRFRGKINSCGIIILKLKKSPKRKFGFQNGDIVVADVPKGKYAGHHVGRVMTRANGYFDIRKTDGSLVTVSHKYCKILQRDNGYQYCYGK